MATIDFSVSSICASGGHVTVMAIAGGKSTDLHFHTDDLQTEVSNDEAKAALMTIIQWAVAGKTPAQAKAKINGMSIIL